MVSCLKTRLRSIQFKSISHSNPNYSESMKHHRSMRWPVDIWLSLGDKDSKSYAENANRHQICQPETNFWLQHCRQCAWHWSDIDAHVEVCVYALNCDGRIDDYALTRVQDPNGLFGPCVLLCDERGDVWFNTSSAAVEMLTIRSDKSNKLRTFLLIS